MLACWIPRPDLPSDSTSVTTGRGCCLVRENSSIVERGCVRAEFSHCFSIKKRFLNFFVARVDDTLRNGLLYAAQQHLDRKIRLSISNGCEIPVFSGCYAVLQVGG